MGAVDGMQRKLGHTGAGGHMYGLAGYHVDRKPHAIDNALGDGGGHVGVGVTEEDHEFITTVAADEVFLAHRGAQNVGQITEMFIARAVSIGVVDDF